MIIKYLVCSVGLLEVLELIFRLLVKKEHRNIISIKYSKERAAELVILMQVQTYNWKKERERTHAASFKITTKQAPVCWYSFSGFGESKNDE